MAQQIKKKFIAPDAIDGSKLKLMEGEAVRLQTPAGEVELLKKDAQGKLVSEGEEISFKDDMEAHVESVRSSLQSNIDAEESARIADVDAEESRAMGVESSLQSQITQEISDRQADVDAEQSRAEGVESSLQSQITQEVSDRQSEVTRVEGLLSTEESARIAGDLNLQNQINNVLSNIDPAALDSLTEIIAAFQEADGSLQGAISTLAGNSSGNIEAEQSRAEAAEASLQAQITQEISDRQADVDAEEMRAMEVEGSLQSQLSQEISDRIADVNAEESARIAEDLTLLKLNGSRAMTGALNMGGGTPTLTTVPKSAGSYLVGTSSNIIGESAASSFGTQVGGDYDGLDYIEREGVAQVGFNQVEIGFSNVSLRIPYGMPTSFPVVAKETIGEVVDGFGTFRFYLAASSLAFFESPESLLVENRTDSKVTYTPSFGFLNNGFDSTTESFSIFRVTSGVFGQGTSSMMSVAQFVGGVGGGSWTFVDSNYIKGTPTVNSSGVVTYYEADNNVGWNNIQRVYQYSEKILSSSSFKITNLASGTFSSDAANYGQVMSVSLTASNIQTELNTTQTGAGLSATGNYVPNMMSNFISGATSLSNADKFLDDAIKSEESRAMGVEGSLQSQITQEISDRQADVDAEESRAMGVESSLQSQITQEISDRQADVDAEESRAMGVESSLQSQITQEISDRQADVNAEQSRAEAAEASLQSQIDNVLSNLDPAALDSLTEIVAAFQSADSSLQGAISTLAGNSSGNIEAEESRAMAVEASLQSQITQEISDRIADVDAEQSRAEGVEASLQSQITQEISNRIADVDAEESRAMGVESSLQSQISQEISDRQADVDAEESRALAAEGSLQSQISQEISDRMAAVSAEESARIAEDLTFFKKDGSREMTGSIIPSIDVSFDLGSSSKRFRDLYLSGSTIDLGGVTLSNESNEFVVRDSSNNELAIVSDNVREGMVNKFFTESRVQETEMSMLDVTKSGEVVSTDSLVDAVSKLQNQMTQEISDRQDDVDTEESRALAAEGLLDGRLDVLEALAFEKESFTLGVNPTGVTLAHSPKAKSTVMFVGRLALHEGLDYSISGNQVTFIGDFAYNSEDEIAAAEGDVVKVTYYY